MLKLKNVTSLMWLWPLTGLVLLLTACGDHDSAQKISQRQESNRLHLAMMQPPRSGLNPFSDDAFKLSRWSTAETLVKLDRDGTPEPLLATEWTQIDPLNWLFTLREGVKFHNGETLTSAQVVTALNTATQAIPRPRILDGFTLTARAAGPQQVTITTQVPDPLLPNRLSSPQLAILASQAYTNIKKVDPLGTGTGPFELTRIEGTRSAHLDRFDEYWGDPAQLSGIDADFVPDGTARAAALRTGAVDLVEAIPVSQAALIDSKLIHEVPMPRTNTLYLNTRKPPFDHPGLRAAARQAIERAQIIKTVYENRADLAEGLLGPALPWAAPLRQPIQHAEAITPVEGTHITLATFTDRAELPEVAVLVAQQLTHAGFTVTQDIREYANIESDALAGRFDAFILSRATVLDSGDPVAYMKSDFSCAGSFNIAQLCDPKIDEALDIAAQIPTGHGRKKAIMAAEAAILATDAAIPMLHERVIQGEQIDLKGAIRDPRERRLIDQHTQFVNTTDSL